MIAAITSIVIALLAVIVVGYYALEEKEQEIYVGVAFCGNSVENAKLLIDRVRGYTNLFVMQSGELQRDLTSVNELGDYAVSAGLYFLPYFGAYVPSTFSVWLENATHRWGTRFLGVYFGDEPGGKMLDDYVNFEDANGDSIIKTRYGDILVQKPNGVNIHYKMDGIVNVFQPANTTLEVVGELEKDTYATFYPNGTITVAEANSLNPTTLVVSSWGNMTYQSLTDAHPFKNVDEIAKRFCSQVQNSLESLPSSTRVFTSDYALYWFDYLSGYDTILAQIGWNNSFAQNIALVRGAARLQNKDWGVDITWKYNAPPYLDNGTEILGQMRLSYECGAKYVVLFDYYENDENPYGTLKDEHFLALDNFWYDVVKNHGEAQGSTKADMALILPKNYACGMRWKEDKIWGIIDSNDTSQQAWESVQNALSVHGLRFDLVYDDSSFPSSREYPNSIFWNQTD